MDRRASGSARRDRLAVVVERVGGAQVLAWRARAEESDRGELRRFGEDDVEQSDVRA